MWIPEEEVRSIASAEYIMDGSTLREYVGSAACIRIPEGVSAIDAGAFRDRKQQLEEVVLPASLREIPPRAFASCRLLRRVELPQNLRAIGAGAFQDCEALTEIEIPAGVRKLRRNTFAGCRSLRRVRLSDGLEALEDGTFRNCRSLKGIRLPATLRAVGSTAAGAVMEGGVFAGSGLRELQVPDGVKTIGSAAFAECRSLRRADLPAGLRQIGSGAFSGCRDLGTLRIPDSVQVIGAAAFRGCCHPEEIVLPRKIEKLRMNAGLGYTGVYNGCVVKNGEMTGCDPDLREVRIPAGVTAIRAGAFNALVDRAARQSRQVSVRLPEALEVFERSRGSRLLEFVVPPKYLQQTRQLPMPFTLDLISGGALPVSVRDAAHLFLFQTPQLSRYAQQLLGRSPDRSARAIYLVLRTRRSPRALLRAAAFAEQHQAALGPDVLPALYRLAAAAGCGAAAVSLARALDGLEGVERFCRDFHPPDEVDAALRVTGLDPENPAFGQVRLLNGSPASAHLVKCLLFPYLRREVRLLQTADPAKLCAGLDAEAGQLEKSIDLCSLQAVLPVLFPARELYANPRWFAAYCRYAGSLQISAFDRGARELFADNRRLGWYARAALTLNDTREAMCRAAEYTCPGRFGTLLGYWSSIRGRDVPLADGAMRVHLDAAGVRRFDFPGRSLEVRLSDTLELNVWDPEQNERLQAASGWGLADRDAAVLRAELGEMKAHLCEFLRTEKETLNRVYLTACGFAPAQWKRLYLQDPVRRLQAQGLIWSQGVGRSFRVGRGGPEDWTGRPVEILPGRRVRLAHVTEMEERERSGWLAAPAPAVIDQMGERPRLGQVPEDHYHGLTITARDKKAFEETFGSPKSDPLRLTAGGRSSSFAIACHPETDGSCSPPESALLRLGSFCCFMEDRAANLALNLLDDMVIRERIRADDTAALRLIEAAGCNDAQIRRYLDLALEEKSHQLAAALLELQRGRPAGAEDFELL